MVVKGNGQLFWLQQDNWEKKDRIGTFCVAIGNQLWKQCVLVLWNKVLPYYHIVCLIKWVFAKNDKCIFWKDKIIKEIKFGKFNLINCWTTCLQWRFVYLCYFKRFTFKRNCQHTFNCVCYQYCFRNQNILVLQISTLTQHPIVVKQL